jgi:hypothetical protein
LRFEPMPRWPARRSHPERSYGSFQRSFYVPEGVDRDKIAADFSKGVLTVDHAEDREGGGADEKDRGEVRHLTLIVMPRRPASCGCLAFAGVYVDVWDEKGSDTKTLSRLEYQAPHAFYLLTRVLS